MVVQRCPQISELIGPAIISFEASCPRGRMQYGLLAKDMTTILDARTLDVEYRFTRIELFVPLGEEAAAIVIRPEIEVECEARLRAIEARHLTRARIWDLCHCLRRAWLAQAALCWRSSRVHGTRPGSTRTS